jgi:hypothetical protein
MNNKRILLLAASTLSISLAQAIPLPDSGSVATSSTAFQITNTGTGKAGQFDISNASNAAPALTATSNGTGYGLFSLMTGTGRSGYFQINNTNNSSGALSGVSNGKGFGVYGLMTGIGRAGHFEINNSGSSNTALSGTSNGSGYSLAGFMTGAGRAGYFQISNASNAKAALEVTTNGSGPAIKGVAGTGLAGEFSGNVSATGSLQAGSVMVGGTLETSSGVLELVGGGSRMYRLEASSYDPNYGYVPNVIGGWRENSVGSGVVGATIGGGGHSFSPNQVNGSMGTISGGAYNTANGQGSTVSGGYLNIASGSFSTVSGGYFNAASGYTASVNGGTFNTASGNYSFAAGKQAKAVHDGTFIWADSTGLDVTSAVANEVIFRASGGIRLFTHPQFSSGVYVPANGNQWLGVSDRNMKNHFKTLDPKQMLDKFTKMPITEWSYKTQDPSIRHMGPTAQDFYSAFGLGEDKLRIGTMDADGVMMAAIQGLNEKLKDKEKENAQMKNKIIVLEKKNVEMEARLARLERLLPKVVKR